MNKIRLWVLVIVTLGILTGCDSCGGNDGHVEYITTSFGTIPVMGSGLTTAEITHAAGNIKTALNAVYPNAGTGVRTAVANSTIIVERTSAYNNYSTTRNGNTIHINFAIVNNQATLDSAINASCALLGGSTGFPEVSNAAPPVRNQAGGAS